MTAVKALALGIVVVTGVALEARGEPVRRRPWWGTSRVASRRGRQAGLSRVPVSVSPAPVLPSPPPPPPVVSALPVHSSLATESWQKLGRFATTSPVASAPPVQPTSAPAFAADLFLNFGDGPYPPADTLTIGGAQPWYTSPVVTRLFGGVPDDRQRAGFTGAVLRRVEEVYRRSGLPLSVTADPGVAAAHTLSVVSHAHYAGRPDAFGVSGLGTDGFSFIDRFGEARSIEALQVGLGNSLSHEFIHAAGVGHHHEIGPFIDAAVLPWPALSDPATGFSAEVVQDLTTRDFRSRPNLLFGPVARTIHGQGFTPQPVPEPVPLVLWAVAVSGLVWARRGQYRPVRSPGRPRKRGRPDLLNPCARP